MHESLALPRLPAAHRRRSRFLAEARRSAIWAALGDTRASSGTAGVRSAGGSGALLPARLNPALHRRRRLGNEADVSAGCSASCLAISRYEK